MPPKLGGKLEWMQAGYMDNISALYVSDDEYQGTADELEADIQLARRLATMHRVTEDWMLLRAS